MGTDKGYNSTVWLQCVSFWITLIQGPTLWWICSFLEELQSVFWPEVTRGATAVHLACEMMDREAMTGEITGLRVFISSLGRVTEQKQGEEGGVASHARVLEIKISKSHKLHFLCSSFATTTILRNHDQAHLSCSFSVLCSLILFMSRGKYKVWIQTLVTFQTALRH